ncbi:hypothetical protein N7456_003150 [Penicillium angulare]|uniref:EKC/KEOPS complex subunit BUD32 n=1 Tax=Penicillium angulare TaxID=116970 RepID=A0A9W9FUQ9_9EURO|nr:hypothetical protein N7456_003150 [Penicillium angulare]
MHGYPVLIHPKGSIPKCLAIGSIGIICQSSSYPDRVIKAPIRHKLEGCSPEVIKRTLHNEEFSRKCFDREKSAYRILPKHPNILHCIEITDDYIHLLLIPHGDLRQYLGRYNHEIGIETRKKWTAMAIDAISTVHSCGIIHADISTRNFLVSDDLSIKLCDFSGSAIGDQVSLVQEEDRYRMDPESPLSVKTDIFATGCLIFEIMTGLRPYDEIKDEEWEDIVRRYSFGIFPCLDNVPCGDIILKCWNCSYRSMECVKTDLRK